MQELSDNETVKRHLKGDEEALEVLIKRYLKPIYSFVYKNIGDGAVSADYGVNINPADGSFSGYAWGSDVIGWLSFARPNYNVATTFDFNRAPSAEDLEANQGDYCTPPPHLTLNWNFFRPVA